ncbi:MAG TPA: aromatic amino acid hydroxylase [Polyangiaceae bacterium]|nr:aromatic amino acid hydroxylase [Polyangiaceae bacterium]
MQHSVVPPHLRKFVVRQDYEQYTEEDQAVWRFVVMQTHARLLDTAHGAYRSGFAATGIQVDRIPRIEDVDAGLSRFGWRAVCVDGFVPPRAFQEFQAAGILPIAADIRTSRHLTYTPAPDIIHEAAGHAPFLAEPHFARYLRRIGEVARTAFGRPADGRVYDAIYLLSEVKENPASTPFEVAAAERALERERAAAAGFVSESARIARLYWWTAEYGLVGTPTDYRLYGAGLLSSIGEAFFLRLPEVRKVPLSAACVDVDYDITRAQPQLFVARSLSQLDEVLDEVSGTLACRKGGAAALREALASEDLATLVLDSGAEVVGTVSRIHEQGGRVEFVELRGPVAVARAGACLEDMPRVSSLVLPLGNLEDGTPLSALSPDAVGRHVDSRGILRLSLSSGASVSGRLLAVAPSREGRVFVVLLADVEIRRGEAVTFRHAGPCPLALGERVVTARAGAASGFFEPTAPPETTVPKPRTFDPEQRELQSLYVRALAALRSPGGGAVRAEFRAIADRLDVAFPDEWLLRWNLLESLVKLGERSDLVARLESDLERLELRFDRREPIATGLEYVRSLTGGGRPPLSHAG